MPTLRHGRGMCIGIGSLQGSMQVIGTVQSFHDGLHQFFRGFRPRPAVLG
jgi:hypothetical protein